MVPTIQPEEVINSLSTSVSTSALTAATTMAALSTSTSTSVSTATEPTALALQIAAAMVQPAPAPEPSAPTTKTWYLFTPIEDGCGIYSGKTSKLALDAPQPANSSPWQPPAATPGLDTYHDGIGWFQGLAYKSITIDTRRSIQSANLDLKFMMATEDLQGSYPETETSTWARQEQDALAYKSTKVASVFLTALATARNQKISDLVTTILAKADAYNGAYAALLGSYQASKAAVPTAAAKDLPALNAFDMRTLWVGAANSPVAKAT